MDKTIVIEDLDTNRFWLIKSDGTVTALSESEVDGMGVRRGDWDGDFSVYDGGMYIPAAQEALNNQSGVN